MFKILKIIPPNVPSKELLLCRWPIFLTRATGGCFSGWALVSLLMLTALEWLLWGLLDSITATLHRSVVLSLICPLLLH